MYEDLPTQTTVKGPGIREAIEYEGSDRQLSVPGSERPRSPSSSEMDTSNVTNEILAHPNIPRTRATELSLIHYHFKNIIYSPRSPWAERTSMVDAAKFLETYTFITSNEHILYSVFAVSASHLLVTLHHAYDVGIENSTAHLPSPAGFAPGMPSDITAEELERARDDYRLLAIQEQVRVIANITAENVNSVIFASIMLSTTELVYLSRRPLHPYEPPISWLKMGHGIGVCYDTAEQQLNVPINDWASGVRDVVNPSLDDPEVAYRALTRTGEIGRALLTPTHYLGEDLPEETAFAMYEQAVKYIGTLLMAIDEGVGDRVISVRVVSFPAWMEQEYFDFVEQKRPRALIILAHLFSVARRFPTVWWVKDTPEREISAIWGALPPEWRTMMPET